MEDLSPDEQVSPSNRQLPSDAVDLVTEDHQVVEEAQLKARQRGEPQTRAPVHVLYHDPEYIDDDETEVEEVYDADYKEDRQTSDVVREEVPGGDPVAQLESIEERVTAETPGLNGHRPGLKSPFDEDQNPWA